MFAYLSHSTQYAGTRILSFIGECDESFNCSWPVQGQGQYDHSADFIASQSFDDPRGRRVLIGWVGGPHGTKFTGAQSIPRMIVADPGGPLRFLPLPELTSLHTNAQNFSERFVAVGTRYSGKGLSSAGQENAEQNAQPQPEKLSVGLKQQHATSSLVVVASTTNSYHLNVSFDVTELAAHPRTPSNASVALRVFVPQPAAGEQADSDGLTAFTLYPPWSQAAQKPLSETSLMGEILVRTAHTRARARTERSRLPRLCRWIRLARTEKPEYVVLLLRISEFSRKRWLRRRSNAHQHVLLLQLVVAGRFGLLPQLHRQ